MSEVAELPLDVSPPADDEQAATLEYNGTEPHGHVQGETSEETTVEPDAVVEDKVVEEINEVVGESPCTVFGGLSRAGGLRDAPSSGSSGVGPQRIRLLL